MYTANAKDYVPLHTEWMHAGRTHRGIVIRVQRRNDVGIRLRALLAVLEAHPDGLDNLLLWV